MAFGKKRRSNKSKGPRPKAAVNALRIRLLGGLAAGTILKRNRLSQKTGNRFNAAIIGRPALAKRIAARQKNPEVKNAMIFYGRLPFITAGEIIGEFKGGKFDNRGVAKMHKFRCFSMGETEKLRSELRSCQGSEAEWTKFIEKNTPMLNQRATILNLAAIEPELTSIVFRELLPLKGIDSKGRAGCIELINNVRLLPKGAGFVAERVNPKTGESMKIVLKRRKDGGWDFRKEIREKKK